MHRGAAAARPAELCGGVEMNVREWLSDRWHRRRDPRGDAGIDMAAVRALAREAARYDDLSEAPDPDLWAHLDTEGFSPSPAWRAGQVPVREPGQWDRRGPAEPWRHQWNVIEGGDLTPWMSPEERAAAAAPTDPRGVDIGRPFPFIPTHEYCYEFRDGDGTLGTEQDEFMVVEGRGYTRAVWENGAEPDLTLDTSGGWSARTGGSAFQPVNEPTSLPWQYVQWQDGAGSWHTL